MKKILLVITIFLLSVVAYSQKMEVKKDTLIITDYEKISVIKIAGKIYKIKIELEEIKPAPISGTGILTIPNWWGIDSTNIGPRWLPATGRITYY